MTALYLVKKIEELTALERSQMHLEENCVEHRSADIRDIIMGDVPGPIRAALDKLSDDERNKAYEQLDKIDADDIFAKIITETLREDIVKRIVGELMKVLPSQDMISPDLMNPMSSTADTSTFVFDGRPTD